MSVESGIPSPSVSVPKTRIVGSSDEFPSVSIPLSLISLTSFSSGTGFLSLVPSNVI
jgi:hypothetical protein